MEVARRSLVHSPTCWQKKMSVAAVENFMRGISISGSGVVKFESMCSDISTGAKHVSKVLSEID